MQLYQMIFHSSIDIAMYSCDSLSCSINMEPLELLRLQFSAPITSESVDNIRPRFLEQLANFACNTVQSSRIFSSSICLTGHSVILCFSGPIICSIATQPMKTRLSLLYCLISNSSLKAEFYAYNIL